MIRNMRPASLLGVGGLTVLLAGCGGSGGSTPPVEPDVGFECKGSVGDGSGDTLLLPTGASSLPPLDICAPRTILAADAVTKCTDKCNGMLQGYADAINARGGTMVTVGQLTCSIQQFEQISSDCPNMDPPGIPEPPFSGGPSQYVADLSGNLHFAVDTGSPLGTVSSDSGAQGQLGYTIIPLDLNCPPDGCDLLVTSLSVAVNDFDISASFLGVTLFDHNVTGMHIQNAGWITGKWHPDGHFEIPAGTGRVVVTLSDDGQHTSLDRPNNNAITGTINPLSGGVSFDNFSQNESDTTITLQSFAGSNVSTPPTAVITLPDTIECNQPNRAAVTLDGSASTSANGPLHFFSWRVNGGATLSGPQVSATLNLGSNDVALEVFNQSFGVGLADRTIHVVDTTPPTFQPLPDVTDTVCDPNSQASSIAIPTATDICSPVVTVTGAVISSNGKPLTTPIPIQNGTTQVPAGVHVIRWTAVDQSGQVSTTTQTLTVRPALESSNSMTVDDRALVKVPGGGFALLGNTGTGLTNIGVRAQTGTVLTQGDVFLRDRAIVNGNVQAAGQLQRQNQTLVTGSVTTGLPVPLPLGRDLSGVTFPTTNAGSITVQPDTVRTLAPGSYAAVTAFSRSRLTLSAGTYFMSSLDLEPQARLNLDQSAGSVQIFVKNGVIDRGQIASVAGAPGGFLLGYAGTSALLLDTPFLAGTIIAPNAKVVVTSLGPNAFSGELFAKDIEVQPDAVLTCDAVGRTAQQAGFALAQVGLQLQTAIPGAVAPQAIGSEAAPGEASGCSVNAASPRSGWRALWLAWALGAVLRKRKRTPSV